VKDTNIQNCNVGINIATSGGFIVGAADKVRLEKMTTNGIAYGTNGFGTIRDSFIVFNGTDGVSMTGTNTTGRVNVESCVVANNGTGVRAGGAGSFLTISNTSIMANTTGAATAGGTLQSHGNNQISSNGAAGSAFSPLGQQ
jgi:hypothetical protein